MWGGNLRPHNIYRSTSVYVVINKKSAVGDYVTHGALKAITQRPEISSFFLIPNL
jgi:hypothetical protein